MTGDLRRRAVHSDGQLNNYEDSREREPGFTALEDPLIFREPRSHLDREDT